MVKGKIFRGNYHDRILVSPQIENPIHRRGTENNFNKYEDKKRLHSTFHRRLLRKLEKGSWIDSIGSGRNSFQTKFPCKQSFRSNSKKEIEMMRICACIYSNNH